MIIGLGLVLGENLQLVGQRIRNRLRSRYQAQLLDSIAALTPQQLASPQVSATIQACRSALFDIGRLINSTMAAAAAVVTAATLCMHQRLGYFGLLSQEFGRYEFKVRDAVDLGTPERDLADDQVWQALGSAHSDQIIGRLPDTIDSQLGPQFDGAGLSGGQWQRLALARIYARNAAIWILDEPTSAIGAEAEQQIFAELQRTKQHRITIVVSHRAWTLKGMDRIYVLDDGRIVQQGTYPELVATNGRFSQIFKEQFETDTTTAR